MIVARHPDRNDGTLAKMKIADASQKTLIG